MAALRGRLIDPIKDDLEIYPYRRVWGSLISETLILFALAAVVFVMSNLFAIRLPNDITALSSIGFVLLPFTLWLILSVLRERSVPQPRRRLVVVFVIAALATNAIALPFIEDTLQPDRWLSLESAINRILGYTFSLGIVQELTKYLVLRYTVWHDLLRTRTDAVAYSIAAALGFATMQNVAFIVANPGISLEVVTFRVVENVAINLAGSLFVSLGLSETRFDHPTPFFMTVTVALGALITGIAQPILSGLVNAPFSMRGVYARPLFGFGFALALFAITVIITFFLYNSAERRERDLSKNEDVR